MEHHDLTNHREIDTGRGQTLFHQLSPSAQRERKKVTFTLRAGQGRLIYQVIKEHHHNGENALEQSHFVVVLCAGTVTH